MTALGDRRRVNPPSARRQYVRLANNNNSGKSLTRHQPNNWRNIGTKYQHDGQRPGHVFDTYNLQVTLNGDIDIASPGSPIQRWCQTHQADFQYLKTVLILKYGYRWSGTTAIQEWRNGRACLRTIELWHRGKTRVATSPDFAKTSTGA